MTIQSDFEEWLDQDWPLWRDPKNADGVLVHKLRRTFEAAYLGGRSDERERCSKVIDAKLPHYGEGYERLLLDVRDEINIPTQE